MSRTPETTRNQSWLMDVERQWRKRYLHTMLRTYLHLPHDAASISGSVVWPNVIASRVVEERE